MPATTIRQSASLEPVADAEQPVQPGDADVVDLVHAGAVHARGERGLGGDRRVGGAGADDRDRARAAAGSGPSVAARATRSTSAPIAGDRVHGLVGEPGGEHRPVGVLLVQRGQDRDDLLGRLAGAVHDLGVARARGAVEVDPGEAQVLGARVVGHLRNLSPARTRGGRRWSREVTVWLELSLGDSGVEGDACAARACPAARTFGDCEQRRPPRLQRAPGRARATPAPCWRSASGPAGRALLRRAVPPGCGGSPRGRRSRTRPAARPSRPTAPIRRGRQMPRGRPPSGRAGAARRPPVRSA